MENAIQTFSLTKIFSDWWGRTKVYAVDDLNLKIRHNEVFGLLGPNGSGKTTTIKMLLGLLHPTSGKSVVLGGDGSDPKINARIGFLPEESYLYKYLNARETLDFYGRLFKLPSKVRKLRTEALLDMVGLKAVANRAVGTYSKGMARRIGLAQALINDPELLILDEPTTGLDPLGTRQIKDLIMQLAKRGKTVLLCSHLLADVEDVCDRIAILYGGKIQSEGKVKDLLQQSDKIQITTGPLSSNTLDAVERLIQKEKVDYQISSPMDKLENFFVNIVTAAQKQAIPTSGAVSHTQIGDFLTVEADERSRQAAILDKLVSASDSKTQTQTTEETEPAETTQPKADEKLISKLTAEQKPPEPEPVTTTEPVGSQDEKQEEMRKNILDQLTGQNDPKETDTEITGSPEGGDSDA